MSINQLPSELISNIFKFSNPQDIPKMRTVCHTFNDIVKRNYIFLPRVAYNVRLFMENNQILIAHKKSGNANGCTKNIFEFDFDYWREISIVEIELLNINVSLQDDNTIHALDLVIYFLKSTKQNEIRKINFNNVMLDSRYSSQINCLLEIAVEQCENVVVEDSSLPITIDENRIKYSKFDYFRWINSSAEQDICSDYIVKKLQLSMKNAVNKRSFLVEINSVNVETVCDFIDEWLRLPVASFFNLSFHNCDDTWKSRFLAECKKRKLTHNYMEFQSQTHSNAHVKVSFSQDARTCCLWPILDVPARTTGQSVCYARYFRDF